MNILNSKHAHPLRFPGYGKPNGSIIRKSGCVVHMNWSITIRVKKE
jgi:hypothetical protein